VDSAESFPELRYPWWRDELIAFLGELVDTEYQERHWVRGEVRDPNRMEGLEFVIDFFDDAGLFDGPAGMVGFVLYDAIDVGAVSRVAASLDAVLSEVGPMPREDVSYLRSRLWPEVVAAAGEALRVFRERPTKYPPPGVDAYADAMRVRITGRTKASCEGRRGEPGGSRFV
jgi:hypothetical protein